MSKKTTNLSGIITTVRMMERAKTRTKRGSRERKKGNGGGDATVQIVLLMTALATVTATKIQKGHPMKREGDGRRNGGENEDVNEDLRPSIIPRDVGRNIEGGARRNVNMIVIAAIVTKIVGIMKRNAEKSERNVIEE